MTSIGPFLTCKSGAGAWQLVGGYVEVGDTATAAKPTIGDLTFSAASGNYDVNTLATSHITITLTGDVEDIIPLAPLLLTVNTAGTIAEGAAGYIAQYVSRDVSAKTVKFAIYKSVSSDADPVVTSWGPVANGETVKGFFYFLVKRTTGF